MYLIVVSVTFIILIASTLGTYPIKLINLSSSGDDEVIARMQTTMGELHGKNQALQDSILNFQQL